MRKFLFGILCSIPLILTSCSNEIESTIEEDVYKCDITCNEFDINTNQFTSNPVLTISLTNEFQPVDQADLVYQDPYYYIGEYKKYNDKNELIRTISIYEYNIDDISNISTPINDTWYIDNESINDTSYIKKFYTKKSKYIIGLDIVNNTQEALTLDDSFLLMQFFTNDVCQLQDNTEIDKSVFVDGSLTNPASINEWVNTTIYNPISMKYEPIGISITGIYVGDYANQIITTYNNTHIDIDDYVISNSNQFEYIVYEYSIYFPTSFTNPENTNIDVASLITICNINDDNNAINGFTNLDKKLVDISTETNTIKPGMLWTTGLGFYEIPIGYTNYLIKIKSNTNEFKYFQPV